LIKKSFYLTKTTQLITNFDFLPFFSKDMAQENFDRISRLIKKEVELFDIHKAEDFKKSIIQYLEAMAKSQDDISAQWEKYIPELQNVSS